MNTDDLDYRTICRACEGSGEVGDYDSCPACDGDGRLNRVEIAAEGHVRLDEEFDEVSGYVTWEEIPISGDGVNGFKERYGGMELDKIIEEAEERGDKHTSGIFSKIKKEERY